MQDLSPCKKMAYLAVLDMSPCPTLINGGRTVHLLSVSHYVIISIIEFA